MEKQTLVDDTEDRPLTNKEKRKLEFWLSMNLRQSYEITISYQQAISIPHIKKILGGLTWTN